MPGRKSVSCAYIERYFAEHQNHGWGELARHTGRKQDYLRAVGKKGGVGPRSERPAGSERGEGEGGGRANGQGRTRPENPSSSGWEFPPFDPTKVDPAFWQELNRLFYLVFPSLPPATQKEGPTGLFGFYKERATTLQVEANRLREQVSHQEEQIRKDLRDLKASRAKERDLSGMLRTAEVENENLRERLAQSALNVQQRDQQIKEAKANAVREVDALNARWEARTAPGVIALADQLTTWWRSSATLQSAYRYPEDLAPVLFEGLGFGGGDPQRILPELAGYALKLNRLVQDLELLIPPSQREIQRLTVYRWLLKRYDRLIANLPSWTRGMMGLPEWGQSLLEMTVRGFFFQNPEDQEEVSDSELNAALGRLMALEDECGRRDTAIIEGAAFRVDRARSVSRYAHVLPHAVAEMLDSALPTSGVHEASGPGFALPSRKIPKDGSA